jgi:diguanylate cyclase (GGDEF)-like protein
MALLVVVFVTLGSLIGADMARADPALDEALSIVDDAIFAIDMQDEFALQDAMTRATTTLTWLPTITVESIQSGDRDALVLIWLGMYLPSGEAFLVASDVVEMERGARQWGLPGDPESDAAIDELDRHASALLEIFDHRGLPLTGASRTVMARNSTTPEFEAFDTAIADLRAQAELDLPDDNWVPPPLSVPDDNLATPTTVPATVVPTTVAPTTVAVSTPPATAPPATAPPITAPPLAAPAPPPATAVAAPPAATPATPPADASVADVSATASDDGADADITGSGRQQRVDVPPENFDDVAEIRRADTVSNDASDETGRPADAVVVADTANDVRDDLTETADAAPNDTPNDTLNEDGSGGSSVPGPAMLAFASIAVLAVIMSSISMVRSRRHADLSTIAYSDALTGLNNRRRFDADVSTMSARGSTPTAMLMLDVDHFKQFNDTFGHAVGDDVLRQVGDVFSRTVRANDVAYRYGGEEFCALLPDTTEADAMAIAERVRRAIEAIEMRLDDGATVSVTASVGVSCGPAEQLAGLVRRADEAVYRAKDDGRNRVAAG